MTSLQKQKCSKVLNYVTYVPHCDIAFVSLWQLICHIVGGSSSLQSCHTVVGGNEICTVYRTARYIEIGHCVSVLAQWWHYGGTTVALWWHYGGTTVALCWHHGGTMVAPWRHCVGTMAALWCHHGGTMVAPWWHHGGTVVAPWRHYGGTMVALWRHYGGTGSSSLELIMSLIVHFYSVSPLYADPTAHTIISYLLQPRASKSSFNFNIMILWYYDIMIAEVRGVGVGV